MTAESTSVSIDEHDPVSVRRKAILVSLCLTVVAAILLAWFLSIRQSHAQILRPLRIEEQKLANRNAQLSEPINRARLASLGGSLEDLRLNLVEVLERSHLAAGVIELSGKFEDEDAGSAMDVKAAAATRLILSLDSVVIHEGVLLDLLATLKAAAGVWPMQVQSCDIIRDANQTSGLPSSAIRARCSVVFMHWYWPEANATIVEWQKPPSAWGQELQDLRFFNTQKVRASLDASADMATEGVLAIARAALAKSAGESAAVAGSGQLSLASEEMRPTASSDHGSGIESTVGSSSAEKKPSSLAGRENVPMIVFGGTIRGTSSMMALLNGIPCVVDQRGQVRNSCGMSPINDNAENSIQDLWIVEAAGGVENRDRLKVVFANGDQISLNVGEQTRSIQ